MTNLTVSSALAKASIRLVSSAVISRTSSTQSYLGSISCSTQYVRTVFSVEAAKAERERERRRRRIRFMIGWTCICLSILISALTGKLKFQHSWIDQSMSNTYRFKNISNMKIGLNQPNGFISHFGKDSSKYLQDNIKGDNIEHRRNQFSPYINHEGTVAAIAGEDFVVVGGDTRLSDGYSIVTRNQSKLAQFTDRTILATSGMYADFSELKRILKAKLEVYEFKIERQPTTESFAHLLSKTLYGRRFFPLYTFNLVAGLDKNGKGVVYGYDAIGSYGADKALAQGSGAHMILPFLDSQVGGYNNPKHLEKPKMTPEKAVEIIELAFRSAAERDIYTGDKLEIIILTKDGVKKQWKQLRRD